MFRVDIVFHDRVEHGSQVILGLPSGAGLDVRDVHRASVDIVVALAIEFLAADRNQRRRRLTFRRKVRCVDIAHLNRQILNRGLVLGNADIEDLVVAQAVHIVDDAHVGVGRIVDVGVAASLLAAVDQFQWFAKCQIVHEMAEYTGVAGFLGRQIVNAFADIVERPDDGKREVAAQAVTVYHPFQQLFGTGIDPAAFVDRPMIKLLCSSLNKNVVSLTYTAGDLP